MEEDLSGRVFGGCRLSRKLGAGAMGSVYLAEQADLRRTMAVKILDARFSSDPGYVERFEREAQSAAQLSHFNIVRVYDFGHSDSRYYIVNEFVDGDTVQAELDRHGALPPEKAVDYALQVARGLAAAQEKSVIHRDIKPENLMITRDGVVKIADFGLAKFIANDASATQAGFIMGTPYYMSPEQAKNLPMDIRSDLYSLGVTLYQLLTGELPFDADSVIGVLLKQISAERPDPGVINPSVPPALSDFVRRLMAVDADDRPRDATEAARELEQLKRSYEAVEAPKDFADVAGVDDSQRAMFKPLPPARVGRVARLDVTGDVLTRMIMSLNSDGGVFVESEAPYPPNSAVEVRFTLPGKEQEYSGIGLVRWASSQPPMKGMGITFIKVQALSKSKDGGGTGMRLSGPMAINALTASPLHQRLLRYIYSNAGQITGIGSLAGALGCGARMLDDPVRTFGRADMIRREPDGRLKLHWPDDEALQREIVAWISAHGLR